MIESSRNICQTVSSRVKARWCAYTRLGKTLVVVGLALEALALVAFIATALLATSVSIPPAFLILTALHLATPLTLGLASSTTLLLGIVFILAAPQTSRMRMMEGRYYGLLSENWESAEPSGIRVEEIEFMEEERT